MGNLKQLVENTNAYNSVSKVIAEEPVVIVTEEQIINEQVQDCMSWIMQLNEDFNNDVIDEETYYAQLEEGFGNLAKKAWNTTKTIAKDNMSGVSSRPNNNPVNAPSPKGRVSNPSQAQNRYNQGAHNNAMNSFDMKNPDDRKLRNDKHMQTVQSNPTNQPEKMKSQGAQNFKKNVDKSKDSNYNNVSYQKNQQMSNQRSQMQRPRFAQ